MDINTTSNSVFATATHALDVSMTQVRRVAQDVAGAITDRPVEGVGPIDGMVGLKQGELLVKLGAKLVQAGDQQLGTLLDITA